MIRIQLLGSGPLSCTANVHGSATQLLQPGVVYESKADWEEIAFRAICDAGLAEEVNKHIDRVPETKDEVNKGARNRHRD